jgi:hypothetical protein
MIRQTTRRQIPKEAVIFTVALASRSLMITSFTECRRILLNAKFGDKLYNDLIHSAQRTPVNYIFTSQSQSYNTTDSQSASLC